MSANRHARRATFVAALATAVLTVTGLTVTPASASHSEPPSGAASNGLTKPVDDPRNKMPGYSFRNRDKLAVDAADALSVIMRVSNTDDPAYLRLRRLVSDEIARRMGLDAAALHRRWSRAPRDHQIAGLAAITQIGVRYVEGKEDPYVQMDCSGLHWYAWRVAGLDMPRQAISQQDRHMRIDREDAVWGDIVGEGTHVHMYLGLGNAMIHAPFKGKRVKLKMMSEAQAVRSVWADPSVIALFRL
ncbi:MAG: hypothetical protein RL383_1381 [Actinomycetota bacterium]|jgi:hypothetical protein